MNPIDMLKRYLPAAGVIAAVGAGRRRPGLAWLAGTGASAAYIRRYRWARRNAQAETQRQLEVLRALSKAGAARGRGPGAEVSDDVIETILGTLPAGGAVTVVGDAPDGLLSRLQDEGSAVRRVETISDAGSSPAAPAILALDGAVAGVADTYGALAALNGVTADGGVVVVMIGNACHAPEVDPIVDPLSWAERVAGAHDPELLSLRELVTQSPGGAIIDVRCTPAELEGLARDAGFAVVALQTVGSARDGWAGRLAASIPAAAILGDQNLAVLRKVRAPRAWPRQPWWPAHVDGRLPLDYMTSRPEVAALVPASARSVLDVGCAAGALGLALRDQGARVTGIERDPELAAQARAVLDEVVVGDAGAVLAGGQGLDPDGYDCVIFADCLEHLEDPWTVLTDAAARLRPNGSVVVSLPNIRHWDTLWNLGVRGVWPMRSSGIHDRTHLRIFTRRSAIELLERAGLTAEVVRPVYRLAERRRSPLDGLARLVPGSMRELVTFQWLLVGRRP